MQLQQMLVFDNGSQTEFTRIFAVYTLCGAKRETLYFLLQILQKGITNDKSPSFRIHF